MILFNVKIFKTLPLFSVPVITHLDWASPCFQTTDVYLANRVNSQSYQINIPKTFSCLFPKSLSYITFCKPELNLLHAQVYRSIPPCQGKRYLS